MHGKGARAALERDCTPLRGGALVAHLRPLEEARGRPVWWVDCSAVADADGSLEAAAGVARVGRREVVAAAAADADGGLEAAAEVAVRRRELARDGAVPAPAADADGGATWAAAPSA